MTRKVEINAMYQHFKGANYYTLAVAYHTETEEPLVIYKRVGEDKVYARPLAMFLSETDFDKYPEATQPYRFMSFKELKHRFLLTN